MSNSSRFHTIIPVFGRPDMLARCLRFISRTSIFEATITVVDDFSDSDSFLGIKRIAQMYPNVRLVRNSQNLGFGQCVNLAVHNSDADFCLVLNSDIIFYALDVHRSLSFMDADERLAVIGYPTTNGNFNRISWGLPQNTGLVSLSRAVRQIGRDELSPIWILDGSALFLRKAAFVEVGGFDPAFGRGYFEDADFGLKLLAKGYRMGLDEKNVYHHSGGASFSDLKLELMATNLGKMYSRWGETYGSYLAQERKKWQASFIDFKMRQKLVSVPERLSAVMNDEPI